MSKQGPHNPHDPPDRNGDVASSDRGLWRTFVDRIDRIDRIDRDSGADHDGPECPGPLELAALIDDRLTAPEREAIEKHLAACAACRAAVAETREIVAERDAALPFVPADVLRAAKRLVETPRPIAKPVRYRIPSLWSFARAGVAAAASIAICIAGYRAGAASSSASVAGDVDLASEMSFGLLDASGGGDEDIDVLALTLTMAENENGNGNESEETQR